MKSNVPKAKTLITYYEIIAIAVVFLFTLYLLYPGERIRTLALKETKNIELTILYLKQITKIYPNDLENWDRLLAMYLKQSDTESAYNLIKEMENSQNNEIKTKSIYLKYNFSKQLFYQTKKDEYKTDIMQLAPKLLSIFTNDIEKLQTLYKDYLSFGFPNISKKFAKHIYEYYKTTDKNLAKIWINEYYKQALATNDTDGVIEYLNVMLNLEPTNNSLRMKLAENYFVKGYFEKAIEQYYILLDTLPPNEKKSLVIKLVRIYQSVGRTNDAATVLKSNEKLFITNEDKKLVIQLYLSLNRLDYASEFSKKIIGE